MTFLPDRVELCGVRILGNGDSCQMRRILEALRQKRDGGKYIAYEGSQLAKIAKCRGGQNGLTNRCRTANRWRNAGFSTAEFAGLPRKVRNSIVKIRNAPIDSPSLRHERRHGTQESPCG